MARSASRSRGYIVVATFPVLPTITGTAKVGQTLTATNGTIVGGTFAGRQFMRDGKPIPGATGTTYVAQAADVGAILTVVSAAALTNGATVTASSAPTAVVVP